MGVVRQRVLTGVGVAALALATPMIQSDEHRNLVAFLDPVRIPTICDGEIENVHLGDTMTAQQCDDLTRTKLTALILQIQNSVPAGVTFNPNQLAAFASFAWNVGFNAFDHSTTHEFLDIGDFPDACKAMGRFVCVSVAPGHGDKDGDCGTVARTKKKLRGLALRRERETAVCLEPAAP